MYRLRSTNRFLDSLQSILIKAVLRPPGGQLPVFDYLSEINLPAPRGAAASTATPAAAETATPPTGIAASTAASREPAEQ